MERKPSSREKQESGFGSLIISIALITLLFIAYNIFTNSKPKTGSVELPKNETSVMDKIMEAFTPAPEKVGVIDDMAAQDSRLEEIAGAESDRSQWVATDYVGGEIKSGQYTVEYGDTLWEIAESVYGDGSQWHKILDANKYSVGFLPNGSQALITVGQNLVIP